MMLDVILLGEGGELEHIIISYAWDLDLQIGHMEARDCFSNHHHDCS